MTDDTVVDPTRRRRRWIVTAAVFLIVAAAIAVGGVMLGEQLKSPAQVAAEASPPKRSTVTAKAELRRLSEPILTRGKMVAGASVGVVPPPGNSGDTAVVTKICVPVGTEASEGRVLLEISGRPIFGLVLPFPLYRDLTADATGPDVREVQLALNRLGYSVTVTSAFDAATQEAVRKFFKARGYPVPTAASTGGAGNAAATPAPTGGSGRPGASGGARGGQTAAGSAQQAADAGSVSLPRSVVIVLDGPHRHVTGYSVKVGTVLTDTAAKLLDLDGEQPGVQVMATRDQVGLLRVGQRAEIIDDATTTTTAGEVVSVGTEPITDTKGASGFDVRLKFVGTVPAMTERTFRVSIAKAEDASQVLAVPVAAIYSKSDGSTFVTVVSPGSGPQDVTVKVGRTAGGWTEVNPQQPDLLQAGATVVVGSQGKGTA